MPAVMAPDIRLVSWADIFEDGDALIRAYAAECAEPAMGEIHPSPTMYAALEQSGLLRCLGAYAEGFMVGFATILTSMLPDYGTQISVVEKLYVLPSYRLAGFGTELMRAVESFARNFGSVGVIYSALPDSRLERLFEIKGYLRTAAVFYRRV